MGCLSSGPQDSIVHEHFQFFLNFYLSGFRATINTHNYSRNITSTSNHLFHYTIVNDGSLPCSFVRHHHTSLVNVGHTLEIKVGSCQIVSFHYLIKHCLTSAYSFKNIEIDDEKSPKIKKLHPIVCQIFS